MPYKDPEKQAEARRKYEEKRKAKNGDRRKVWTGIMYEDSAPSDWKDQLSDLHMRIWVSPLQDKDEWKPADERKDPSHKAGTCKKAHRHWIAEYDVQVDLGTVLHDFGFLNGPSNVKPVKSLRSMVRYLVHLDDPDKAQYDKSEILTFGGAELDIVEQVGTHERYEMLKAMRKYIRDHNIVDYCDFVDYCDDCEEAWSHLLDDNSSYVIEKYIKSRRYKQKEAKEANVVMEVTDAEVQAKQNKALAAEAEAREVRARALKIEAEAREIQARELKKIVEDTDPNTGEVL